MVNIKVSYRIQLNAERHFQVQTMKNIQIFNSSKIDADIMLVFYSNTF